MQLERIKLSLLRLRLLVVTNWLTFIHRITILIALSILFYYQLLYVLPLVWWLANFPTENIPGFGFPTVQRCFCSMLLHYPSALWSSIFPILTTWTGDHTCGWCVSGAPVSGSSAAPPAVFSENHYKQIQRVCWFKSNWSRLWSPAEYLSIHPKPWGRLHAQLKGGSLVWWDKTRACWPSD